MATVTEHKKFVCTDARTNHNKVWEYTLFNNGDVQVRWGRVGKAMQEKTHASVGQSFADKKVREKGKKGYKEVHILDATGKSGSTAKTVQHSELGKIAATQIDHTNPEVKKLITYLVKVNRHDIYKATSGKVTWDASKGLFTTPLGIVTPDTITEARDILILLGDFVDKRKFKAAKFLDLLEDYLVLIPQDIGMKFNPEAILPDLKAVQQQGSILDSLEASYQAVMTQPETKSDAQPETTKQVPKIFDVKLHLSNNSKTIKWIRDFYNKTRQRMHTSYSLDVSKVYTVEIAANLARFNAISSNIGNIMKLWHGTRAANVLSILKGGLIIPPSSSAHVTGRMYGNGVYFSDQSTKSLNYAYGYWDGGSRDRSTFMFLADVAMGKPCIPSSYGSSFPKKGYDSTFAKASRSGVYNNEMIVYNVDQCNLTFLVEFE